MEFKSLDGNYRVGVVGAGTMGRGIAQVAAEAGFQVCLMDAKAGVADSGKGFIAKLLDRAVEKGKLTQENRDATLSRIVTADQVDAFAGCDLVIEAAIENIEIKRELFQRLEDICGPNAVLVSNTSAIPIAAIAAKCKDRSRIAGMHFMNPVPLMKLVEVISTPLTAAAVTEHIFAVGERMGKKPIRVNDGPAFLVGNCARGFYTEALRFVQESIAPPAVVDRIVREAGNFRMGPFEVMDLVGLDVNYPATRSLFEDTFFDPRYRLTPQYRLLVEAGMLGRKTSGGFYAYDQDKNAIVSAPEVAAGGLPKEVWVWGHSSAARQMLVQAAESAGVKVQTSERPASGVLALVAPIGDDASTTAAQLGLDPKNLVAVDTLYGWDKHRTVMAPPGASSAQIAHAIALLSTGGVAVSRINDSPGFVMPRIQAAITNLACDLCQQGVSSPADLDLGMRLGFNFPEGPLEAASRLGTGVMLKLVQGLYDFYADDRYRPSPWLRRREMLGLALNTPERDGT